MTATSSPSFLYNDATLASTSTLLSLTNSRVLVAAHRGAWREAPENSLGALNKAIAYGADIVELDVRSTRDGVLVLLHDEKLDRTSTGKGAVSNLNYREVRQARLKFANAGEKDVLMTEPLPTLAMALEAARDRIVVNIDVKDATQADRVAQAVIQAGMSDQVFVKATVTSPEHIERVRASPFFGRVPFVPMMQARPGRFSSDLRALETLQCPMFEVEFNDIADLEEGRDELCRQGARLWVNTIEASHSLDFNDARAKQDPDAVWGRLLQAGVNAIQTDDVTQLLEYLTRQGRR